MVGDEGHSVTVRLKEIGLSGTKAGTGIEEFNRLSGWVTLYDEAGEMVDNVELTLNAKTGDTELPPNTVGVVWPSTEDFYQAMIGAFADETAEWVKKI